jgi:hypothetical protein
MVSIDHFRGLQIVDLRCSGWRVVPQDAFLRVFTRAADGIPIRVPLEFLKQVFLPPGLDAIGVRAFAGSGIARVEFAPGLDAIGAGAFSGCRNLTSVSPSPCIDEDAAFESSGLVELPEGMRWIGKRAFAECVALKRIVWPASLTRMEDEVFEGCNLLASLELPVGVVEIGKGAFAGCAELKVVTLPPSVRTIEVDAFRGTRIQRIDLPLELDELGLGAFADCKALTTIVIGDVAQWGNAQFGDAKAGGPFDFAKRVTELRLIGENWRALDVGVLSPCLARSARVISARFAGRRLGSFVVCAGE